MKKLSRLCKTFTAEGVKVMFNPKSNETIYILPAAMYGAAFEIWRDKYANEITKLQTT
jgi:hypothetical protein